MSNLNLLIPTTPARVPQSTLMWATVEAVNPLRIRVDGPGDGTLIPGEPFTLTPVLIGDRVAVGTVGGQLTIIGRTGGPPSGTVAVSITEDKWLTRGSTQHMVEVTASALPTPPPGYMLSVSMSDTSDRWAFVGVHSASAKILTIMDVALNKPSGTQTYTIAWQLIRSPGSTLRTSAASFETSEIDALVETHESTLI